MAPYNGIAAQFREPADDSGGTAARIIDFSNPDGWQGQMPEPWRSRMAILRELDERSRRLAAQTEQLLAQPDATSALRGIGYAILALRAEFEAEQERRPDA